MYELDDWAKGTVSVNNDIIDDVKKGNEENGNTFGYTSDKQLNKTSLYNLSSALYGLANSLTIGQAYTDPSTYFEIGKLLYKIRSKVTDISLSDKLTLLIQYSQNLEKNADTVERDEIPDFAEQLFDVCRSLDQDDSDMNQDDVTSALKDLKY